MLDSVDGRARLGLLMRFPSYAHLVVGALDQIGVSRGIRRGRNETDEHYAARLLRWRYPLAHRVRGSAFALLEQIYEYFGGLKCLTVTRRGNRHVMFHDGSTMFGWGVAWHWDSAPEYPRWARFWIVLYAQEIASETPDWGDADLYGGAWGTPGYALGQVGISPRDVQAIRDLVPASGMSWKPAGTMPEWVTVSWDDTDPIPNASWEHWSEQDGSHVQRATRNAAYRYWSLKPALNNSYAGNPNNFAGASDMPGGGTYAGDPAYAPPFILLLPGGETYDDNPGNFASTVQLPDDGSQI